MTSLTMGSSNTFCITSTFLRMLGNATKVFSIYRSMTFVNLLIFQFASTSLVSSSTCSAILWAFLLRALYYHWCSIDFALFLVPLLITINLLSFFLVLLMISNCRHIHDLHKQNSDGKRLVALAKEWSPLPNIAFKWTTFPPPQT